MTGKSLSMKVKRKIFLPQRKLRSRSRGKTVKGKVIDETGTTLPGVAVAVVGSTRGVYTNTDGTFEIEIDNSDKLKFSLLSYKTQTISIKDTNSELLIEMIPEAGELEEVTVVAFGSQRKESVIGAISSVSPEFLQSPGGRLSNNLAGQIAGIVSVQISGEPEWELTSG